MKYKLILIPLMLLLLSSFGFAAWTDGLQARYSLDVNPNNDYISDFNPILYNATVDNVNYKVGSGAFYFAGGNKVHYGNRNYNITDAGGNAYSVNFWVRTTSTGLNRIMMGNEGTGTTDEWQVRINSGSADVTYWQNYNAGGTNLAVSVTGYNLNDDNWHMITLVSNGSQAIMYINGTYMGSDLLGIAGTSWESNGNFTFGGKYNTLTQDFTGWLDEVAIWNRSLDNTTGTGEIASLWNSGAGYNFLAPASQALNVTDTDPNTNTQYSSGLNFIFNVSYNSSSNANVSLWLTNNQNGVQVCNQTIEYTGKAYSVVNFTKNLTDGNYSYFIRVNATSGIIYNSSNATFYIDSVNPIMITNFTNNSIFYGNNITGQFNFSDAQLLSSVNISIDNKHLYYNTTLSNTTHQVNISNVTTIYSNGLHLLNIKYSDGHTAASIDDFKDINDGWIFNDHLKYSFTDKKDNYVKIDAPSILDTMTTEKEIDRYTFDYVPSKISEYYTFRVTSPHTMRIVDAPETEWKRWIIINDDVGRWLDFNEEGIGNIAEYKQISKNEIEVTVHNKGLKNELKFSSIGNLNTVTINYSIWIGNYSEYWESPIIEGSSSTFTLNITQNISFVNNITARLYYNGTTYIPSSVNTSNYYFFNVSKSIDQVSPDSANLTFNWTYTVYGSSAGGYQNLTFNTSAHNQTVNQIRIDNCSGNHNETINFTVFDEDTNIPVVVDFDILFSAYNTSSAYARNFSFTQEGSTNYTYCIYPYYIGLVTDYYIEYGNESYSPRIYSATTYLSNVTQNKSLYLATSTINVTSYVTDTNNEPLEDYLVNAYRYFLTTNSYILTHSMMTDYLGIARMDLKTDTKYRFDIYAGSVLKLSKIVNIYPETTTLYFKIISGGTTALENYLNLLSINGTITHSSTTHVVKSAWTDVGGFASEVCQKISQVNATNGSTQVALNCTSDISLGQINTTLSLTASNAYVVLLEAKSSVDGLYYLIDDEYIEYNPPAPKFGQEGLLWAWVFIGTVSFLAFKINPAAGVIVMCFMLFVTKIMGILSISWPVIIGILICGVIVIKVIRT